jgi:ABC-2 type transport system ATP-binding protein
MDQDISEEIIVDVSNLVKRFGDFTAVDSISFQVKRGEVFGFLGPNGAGKTTTIRMLCGLLNPTSGSGKVGGFDIFAQAEKIKENIGYMSQRFSLYQDLTVEENIDFYSGIYKVPQNKKKERKEWVLRMAGIENKRNSLTQELSGGWKQKLALGCALLHNPPILFLDEPTAGVDPISRRDFWDLIYQVSQNKTTVFVTTHYMDEAEHCDRVGLIYQGKIIALDTPQRLKAELMPEDILNLECEQSVQLDVLTWLQKEERVKEAALFGGGMHIVVNDAEKDLPHIKTLLENKNISIKSLKKITPSLEDVFVSLVEEEKRKNLKEQFRQNEMEKS